MILPAACKPANYSLNNNHLLFGFDNGQWVNFVDAERWHFLCRNIIFAARPWLAIPETGLPCKNNG
jgi:hypothetical protein